MTDPQSTGATSPASADVLSMCTRLPGLTMREVEVLRQVAEGLHDREIARRLVMSPRTVNSHLTAIYAKLGISTRSAATRFAIEHRLA